MPAPTVPLAAYEVVRLADGTILAIGFAIAAIITYVAFRFANPLWGAAGIVALCHDVFVALGLLSITQIEVDLVVMGAILTIAGYSINDTIVIFDRMRERLGSIQEVANALADNLPAPKASSGRSRRRRRKRKKKGAGQGQAQAKAQDNGAKPEAQAKPEPETAPAAEA